MTELTPIRNEAYQTRHVANVPSLSFKNNLKKKHFSSTITEWNKLDTCIQNSATYKIFQTSVLKFIRPSPNKLFHYHNPKEIKLLTRWRLGLSHLQEYRFMHSFQDILNPRGSFGQDKNHVIIYFTVPCFMLNDLLSWTILKKSIVQF